MESGASRLSSSLQNVSPQTLQGYLDSLPETPEYKQAMQSKNPKKGWKPLDGKPITSGKKVAFKPMYDKEGRIRHGVPVRGSDKSEECWRHVEGKAPAGCTFAHSRLGDTLELFVSSAHMREAVTIGAQKKRGINSIYLILEHLGI